MRFGTVALAYHEPRLIVPHLRHIPDWVEEKLVLVSEVPWQGPPELEVDKTPELAETEGATVIVSDWANEQDQRNTGQQYFYDMDWVIILDPDEFLTNRDWHILKTFLEDAEGSAYVCQAQRTYWKAHMVIEPPEDYKQLIAVRPTVRFVDKRVVDSSWGYAPVTVHHMSWARTNAEVKKKINHYSHAHELDKDWYDEVWLTDRTTDLHPLTPESLKRAVPCKLPPELEQLGLWP